MDFRHNSARRRRVMRDDRLEVENVACETTPKGPFRRYLTEQVLASQPTILDFLPTRGWLISLLIMGVFTISVGLIIVSQPDAIQSSVWRVVAEHPEWWSLRHAGSLGKQYLLGLSLGSCLLGFQIWQLRRHRSDDYLGTYQVWLWAVPLLAGMALANFDPIVGFWALATKSLLATSTLSIPPLIFSVLGISVLTVVGIRGYLELKENLVSKSMMVGTLLCGLVGVGTHWNQQTLAWLDLSESPLGNSTHWWLLMTTFLHSSLLSYLGFVYRDVQGLIARVPAVENSEIANPVGAADNLVEQENFVTAARDKKELLPTAVQATDTDNSQPKSMAQEKPSESDSNLLTRRKRRKVA